MHIKLQPLHKRNSREIMRLSTCWILLLVGSSSHSRNSSCINAISASSFGNRIWKFWLIPTDIAGNSPHYLNHASCCLTYVMATDKTVTIRCWLGQKVHVQEDIFPHDILWWSFIMTLSFLLIGNSGNRITSRVPMRQRTYPLKWKCRPFCPASLVCCLKLQWSDQISSGMQ